MSGDTLQAKQMPQCADFLRLLSRKLPPQVQRRLGESLDPICYLSRREIVHPTRGAMPWGLYPYQIRLLTSEARLRLVIKARQTGISQAIAGEVLWKAKFTPETEQVFISRNGLEAKKLITYCRRLAASDPDLNAPQGTEALKIPAFGLDCFPAMVGEENAVSQIMAEAAGASAGRGGGKLTVWLDEVAHGNFRYHGQDIYQSVMPSVSHGGNVGIVSTPRGKANLFYRLYRESVDGTLPFEIHRVVWDQCPAYNPDGYQLEDPHERRAIGEKGEWYNLTRPQFSEQEWAEEYECDFAASAGLVYKDFDELVHVGDYQWNPALPTYVGQDFGYTNPAVALLIQVSPSDDVFVLQEHYRTQRSIGQLIEEKYMALSSEYEVQRWDCDPSGAGEIKELKRAGIPATARKSSVRDGIRIVQNLIKPPSGGPTKFHVDRSCRRFITDVMTYAFRAGTEEPEKNVADHGPDSFRYFAVRQFAHQVELSSELPTAGVSVFVPTPAVGGRSVFI